jgi:hypothetical protein
MRSPSPAYGEGAGGSGGTTSGATDLRGGPCAGRFLVFARDEDVQGVLCEERGDECRVIDAMLTIRPYAGLRTAMRAMGGLMEASPLPSARA